MKESGPNPDNFVSGLTRMTRTKRDPDDPGDPTQLQCCLISLIGLQMLTIDKHHSSILDFLVEAQKQQMPSLVIGGGN